MPAFSIPATYAFWISVNSITSLFQQWESSPNVDRLYNKVYIKQHIDLAQPHCQYV